MLCIPQGHAGTLWKCTVAYFGIAEIKNLLYSCHLPIFSMHLYLNSRYLEVPLHGSPNTELLADTLQLDLWSHFCCTISRELLEVQYMFFILLSMHVCLFSLPYLASRTLIVLPFWQLMVLVSRSQIITDRGFSAEN